jgi:1-deoxy-D-xylulose-5-phosphate reductoisomerase
VGVLPARRRGVPGGVARATAGAAGSTAPAVYNAANEVAVEAFRTGRLEFRRIVPTIADVLALHDVPSGEQLTVDDVLAADAWARREATRLVLT